MKRALLAASGLLGLAVAATAALSSTADDPTAGNRRENTSCACVNCASTPTRFGHSNRMNNVPIKGWRASCPFGHGVGPNWLGPVHATYEEAAADAGFHNAGGGGHFATVQPYLGIPPE